MVGLSRISSYLARAAAVPAALARSAAATGFRPGALAGGSLGRLGGRVLTAASAAVVALVAIQVFIGILFKATQSGGK